MYRIALVVLLTRAASSTMVRHHHRMQAEVLSRQSRSDGHEMPATRSGYIYKQTDDQPQMYAWTTSHTEHPHISSPIIFDTGKSRHLDSHHTSFSNFPTKMQLEMETIKPYVTPASSYKSQYELSRMRSKANYEVSKREPRSHMVDKLKNVMYYSPQASDDVFSGYDSSADFHNDYEDIRSSGKSMYDTYWPYFYHNDDEKLKDKRYAEYVRRKFIPVHEPHENDAQTPSLATATETEPDNNPINGNGPFFSFVLNDYVDPKKTEVDDTLTFKGFPRHWGSEGVDSENWKKDHHNLNKERNLYGSESDSSIKPYKSHYPVDVSSNPKRHSNPERYSNYHAQPTNSISVGESATEKGATRKQNYVKHNTGENSNSNHKTGYNKGDNSYQEFRDFLDAFSNKFANGDEKRQSEFMKKINQDKGEKKKGFHRVYHKDEFQEDKEFYDNNGSTIKAEDKGSANAHIGATEAFLLSKAIANLKNAAAAAVSSGNTDESKYNNFKKGLDESNALDTSFHKYIDVAKQAAHSNNADYHDTTLRT